MVLGRRFRNTILPSPGVSCLTANPDNGQSIPGSKRSDPHPDSLLDNRIFVQNAAKMSSIISASRRQGTSSLSDCSALILVRCYLRSRWPRPDLVAHFLDSRSQRFNLLLLLGDLRAKLILLLSDGRLQLLHLAMGRTQCVCSKRSAAFAKIFP